VTQTFLTILREGSKGLGPMYGRKALRPYIGRERQCTPKEPDSERNPFRWSSVARPKHFELYCRKQKVHWVP